MSDNIAMESILSRVIELLDTHKIHYWVTDGTLLGIIRENRLLPWDSDIDVGVWRSEVSTVDIIKMFEKNGFEYIETLPDMHCLHFLINNIQVDIGLYSKNDKEVSIKWATHSSKIFDMLVVKIIAVIFDSQKRTVRFRNEKRFSILLSKHLIGIFGYFLTKNIKEKIYNYARNRYVYLGSTYPVELLKFKTIEFKDIEVVVPINSDEYLRLNYGELWRTPNQDYVWEKDTFNLKAFIDQKK